MDLARRTLIVTGTVAVVVVVLILAWLSWDVLLLGFGGLVLAVFLRTLADWIAGRTHLGPSWSLALAVDRAVLAPLLHWNFVLLPPALTIFTQALLLSLVGLPGVFLATPILACIRILVLDAYVRRVLEREADPGLGGTGDAERDRVGEIGSTQWAIAEGYIPGWSHGAEPAMTSHETVCLLNTTQHDAHVEITVYFSDRDPVGPYRVTVPARRTRHVRFNDLRDPAPIPRQTDYASVIESDVPIVVQHTRLDSRQAENALITTVAYPGAA